MKKVFWTIVKKVFWTRNVRMDVKFGIVRLVGSLFIPEWNWSLWVWDFQLLESSRKLSVRCTNEELDSLEGT